MTMIKCQAWSGTTTGPPGRWEEVQVQSRYVIHVRPGRAQDTSATVNVTFVNGDTLRVKADTWPELSERGLDKPKGTGGRRPPDAVQHQF
jgi:hypothetical protein